MTRERFNEMVIIGVVLAGIGFILLFFSTSFGFALADNWLFKQGGADTAMYHIRIESYITNFVVAGGILLGIGLITIILTFFMKMIDPNGGSDEEKVKEETNELPQDVVSSALPTGRGRL